MKTLKEFVENGLTVINDMGERRESYVDFKRGYSSIVFSNNRIASICYRDNEYSVAVCDYNGYFNWKFFDNSPFEVDMGSVNCDNEEKVCGVLEWIKSK